MPHPRVRRCEINNRVTRYLGPSRRAPPSRSEPTLF